MPMFTGDFMQTSKIFIDTSLKMEFKMTILKELFMYKLMPHFLAKKKAKK